MTRLLLRAALLTILLSGIAAATTLRRLSLEDVALQAQAVVVGTVHQVNCVEGGDDRGMIYTDVELDRLEVWKGTVSSSTITYRFAGGKTADRSLTVAGMPRFEKGKRYVLFANPDDDEICPLAGWGQGRYEVRSETSTGIERIHDSDGHPVFGFEKGSPVLRPSKERPRALTLVEFQVEVARALETAARRAELAADDPSEAADVEEKAQREQPPAHGEDGGGR